MTGTASFSMVVSPGGVKLRRTAARPTPAQRSSVAPELPTPGDTEGDRGPLVICSTWAEVQEALRREVAERGVQLYGRAAGGAEVREFSRASRLHMRWVLNSLPWDEVPGRLALVTLTYPRDWRRWCNDGATLKQEHVARWKSRWRRQWGRPVVGAWAMEFQTRGAPHVHAYVGLPPVEVDEFRVWVRDAWWRTVGSNDRYHRLYGVDVRPCTYGSAEVNAARVADYFWRESGKWRQKQPPEGFERLGRYWGYWGMKPRYHEHDLSRDEYVAIRRPVRTLQRKVAGRKVARSKKHSMDGCYAVGVDGLVVGVRLLRWAQQA